VKKSVHIAKHKVDIYACNRTKCAFCLDNCPVYSQLGFEQHGARGKMQIARAILEGKLDYSEPLSECIYACTGCGYCQWRCSRDIVKVFESLRVDLVEADFENLYHRKSINGIHEHNDPYLKPKDERDSWAKGIRFSRRSKTLFYGGCTYSYIFPDALHSNVKLLTDAGVQMNYLGISENCCGYLMHTTGHWREFRQIVKENTREFKKIGVEEIITACQGCYKTLKKDYPEFCESFDVSVRHIMEIIGELVDTGRIEMRKRMNVRVTYHDPCHLGRHMGRFDRPRDLLQRIPGLELVELAHNRYRSLCCGGGGGMPTSHPALAMDIAKKRIKEAEDTGADVLVTACPQCEMMLRKAIRFTKSPLELMDLGAMLYCSSLP